MLSDSRQNFIKEAAFRDGEVIISDIAQELGVSLETVRRDINALCLAGVLSKVHGGAVPALINENEYENKYSERKNTNGIVKKRLGYRIGEIVKDCKTLFLSTGTTVESIANLGIGPIKTTVITNSVATAETLLNTATDSKYLDVVLLGGRVNAEEHFTYGSEVVSGIKKYHADVAVISAVGIDEKGAMCASAEEGAVISEMVRASSKVILVADSTKFGKKSFYRTCPVNKINKVVTDGENPLSEAVLKAFKKEKVKLEII